MRDPMWTRRPTETRIPRSISIPRRSLLAVSFLLLGPLRQVSPTPSRISHSPHHKGHRHVAWTNQSTNSLNVGPDANGHEISISTDGPVSNGPEIDVYSGSSYEAKPASIYAYAAGDQGTLQLQGPVMTGGNGEVPFIQLISPGGLGTTPGQLNEFADQVLIQANGSNGITLDAVNGPIALEGTALTFNGSALGGGLSGTRGSGTGVLTDGSSSIVVTHGLGVTPTAVMLTIRDGNTSTGILGNVTAKTSTTFTFITYLVRVGASTLSNAYGTVDFDWLALN
jgi:hypothetical protein